MRDRSSRRWSRCSSSARASRSSASSSRTSRAAGSGGSSRVEATDGTLDALCHVGANLVPSGEGCGAFARGGRPGAGADDHRRGGAVGELWDAPRRLPAAGRARTGPASRSTRSPSRRAPGDSGLRAGHASTISTCSCRPAPPRTQLELGVDPLARDPDGFRWRTRAQIDEGRSWLWIEDGVVLFKAEASAWTPTRGAAPAGLGRPAGARPRLRRARRCATSAACCSSARRP